VTICRHHIRVLVVRHGIGQKDSAAIVDLDMALRFDDRIVGVVIEFICLQQCIAAGLG